MLVPMSESWLDLSMEQLMAMMKAFRLADSLVNLKGLQWVDYLEPMLELT